jgi:hypothetical protein
MLHQQIPQIFTLIRFYVDPQYSQSNFRIAQKKKSPCKTLIYKSLINKSVLEAGLEPAQPLLAKGF